MSSNTGRKTDQKTLIQKSMRYSWVFLSKRVKVKERTMNTVTLSNITRPALFPSSTNRAATREFWTRDGIFKFWIPRNNRMIIGKTVYARNVPFQMKMFLLEQNVTLRDLSLSICEKQGWKYLQYVLHNSLSLYFKHQYPLNWPHGIRLHTPILTSICKTGKKN